MQAKCIDIVVAILYIVLVSALLGWRLFYLSRKKNAPFRKKPLRNSMEGGERPPKDQKASIEVS